MGVRKESDRETWALAEEMLLSSIQDWSSGKKECQQWCEAVLNVFSTRAPHMLLSLPWFEHIRACKKPFVQKTQLHLWQTFSCVALLLRQCHRLSQSSLQTFVLSFLWVPWRMETVPRQLCRQHRGRNSVGTSSGV